MTTLSLPHTFSRENPLEDKSFTNKDQFPPYATWTPAYVQHKKDIVAKGFLVQTTT
jgi:hypothetical protein